MERSQGDPAGVNCGRVGFELDQQLLLHVHQPAFAAMEFRLAAGVGSKPWHPPILAPGADVGSVLFP